ncbi:tetratricopeptide repeat protein [Salinisphaera aquimarina]|uniref:Tetratricopeptide repeat protein n=1 Tax=Salinisphaera aquimarina TaxID=2094031 RepID=A0ABV7EKV4_9GAMM
MGMKERLQDMLAAGQDNALLRFSLGELLHKDGEHAAAAEHLGQAVAFDPDYSAAWKLYGKALLDSGAPAAALEVLEHGITVAEARGDNQAAREMQVFAKRARKRLDTPDEQAPR